MRQPPTSRTVMLALRPRPGWAITAVIMPLESAKSPCIASTSLPWGAYRSHVWGERATRSADRAVKQGTTSTPSARMTDCLVVFIKASFGETAHPNNAPPQVILADSSIRQ
jgi:hypothetical protein